MQTNSELMKVFNEHKHNLVLLSGPSEGLIAALPSLNIIDSKCTSSPVLLEHFKHVVGCFCLVIYVQCHANTALRWKGWMYKYMKFFCCFLSPAPIDDGAVQRLRDLIVSLTLFGLEMECCVIFFVHLVLDVGCFLGSIFLENRGPKQHSWTQAVI